MIDLHCHILPSIDDGAGTLTDSLAMAQKAAAEGIHTIVATPHHQNGKYINERAEILYQVKQLNEALQEHDIPLTVLPGQEVRLYGDLLADYEAGKILTLNETNKYILIEFPSNHVPRYAEQMLYELRVKGMIPIIVHPERNAELIEQPDKLYNLVNKGALTQVTAGSLLGNFGKKIKKFSLQLVEHNLTHMIASDAHNTTTRAFYLQAGYDVIENEFGTNTLIDFKENPHLLISGKSIYKEDPQQIRRKKLFGIF
ncbi:MULTISPECIES: tyrosine-protein phosphatase [unclassified Bacillus (in: firmicutes)]|uniref:tyrosine-protein phosphatase n=1 Tax=unclassified Bacillus (in: firmicutes) TaxID=185979 RepID=UPI0008E545D9|nr:MULTISPECIES: CpsB/CapC family capsule biosynthesis tyrosine phosphatase [unclassified Bacillus (in: firmicutes)]SFJ63768.1 protein-tyrosine phosphatase [Bacillus sp. 71mf]SFT13712.1 protein-tyrosine phosphatase [Bacillus sp. 103mf]